MVTGKLSVKVQMAKTHMQKEVRALITCNLRGMNPTVNVNPKSFVIQDEKSSEKAINFINMLEKEVMKLSSKEKKSLKKKLLTISASISTLSLTTPAMAST